MDDCETRRLYTEGMSNVQRCQSEDSLVELRSGQVENGTPSTSPPYWDTDDDDDDCGPKPSELYGKFTWKIEKFSQINKRELRSNAFEVGGYKWYILIYPQGCDVCNHLSLFLCVANHDKLLPGWSHFAQFTIAVVNKDPKKSKYSDTLHRFWKKEHDWGWKKFMELSKVVDGFINDDSLLIKAQVQVIREKAHRPFRCLDCQYRRELVRLYLSNVEQICRCFIEERKGKLNKLIEDKVRWSSFCAFWLGIDQVTRRRMSRDRTDSILKVVVKNFFVEKEVTSTLVMDSLYSGLKALEFQSKNQKGRLKLVEVEELPAPMVCVDKDMFVLADDVLLLLERAAVETLPHQPSPPKDDKGSQNRTKDGSSGEQFNKDSIERDERRLTELGRRTVEILVLVHIFSSRIEVAYQEAVALRRQEELIREEEAAEQAENELKAKRSAAEKEKRSKKKQAKQKRNSRKSKDKAREEKSDAMIQDKNQQGSSSVEFILDDFSPRNERSAIRKIDAMDNASDMSDTGEDVGDVLQPDTEDRGCSPVNWDTDTSEIHPLTDGGSSEIQNDQMQKKPASVLDDSSSTCSSDSIPSSMNGSYKGKSLRNNKNNRSQTSPTKGKSQTAKDIKSTSLDTRLSGANGSSGPAAPESGANLSLKDLIQWSEKHRDEKEEDFVSPQKKRIVKDPVDLERSYNSIAADSSSPSSSTGKKPPSAFLHQPKQSYENMSNTSKDDFSSISTTKPELMHAKEATSSSAAETGKSVPPPVRSPQIPSTSRSEAQKPTMPPKSHTSQQGASMGRPSSAPLTPAPRPTAPVVSTVQTAPLLSRSMSAAGRLGTEPSPFAPSYIPQSYRNAMMGKTTVGPSHPPLNPLSQAFVSGASKLPLKLKTDQAATKITFGSVKPETLRNQHQLRDDFAYAESSSNTAHYNSNLAGGIEGLNIHGSSQSRIISSSPQGLGEFPHLDIINDLLDEDKNTTRAVVGHYEQSHQQHHNPNFNRHYSFPCSAGMGSFGSNAPYDQMEQHYDEGLFQRVYGSASGSPLHGHYRQMDLSAYAGSQIDGMAQNQWPYGHSSADPRMVNLGNADSAGGYLHELPDYSYSGGVNGYGYHHRPGNGI